MLGHFGVATNTQGTKVYFSIITLLGVNVVGM